MDQKIIREQIRNVLVEEQAHMSLFSGVKDFPMEKINEVFPNGTYTSWHLLEHIRITQRDILDFLISPNYMELAWPKDYWPAPSGKATAKDWEETLKEYSADLRKLSEMIMDEKIDLTAKVANGTGQTYIREFLLVADHTAYHTGEFAIMRQTLNTWKR